MITGKYQDFLITFLYPYTAALPGEWLTRDTDI